MTANRLIYFFGAGQAEGGSEIKHLVGGKGASLADLTRAGFHVPPGFTLSSECCDHYYRSEKRWPDGLEDELRANLARLEALTGRRFGQGDGPLLVSVRSGAAQSMPGMMDTVLNVGLNPACVLALAGRSADPRLPWRTFRQFVVMFGHTVARIEEAVFRDAVSSWLQDAGVQTEEELDVEQSRRFCERLLAVYAEHAGRPFPTEPWEQLRQAIDAVFESWNHERAVLFRRRNGIEGLLGTAVTVQAMCPSEISGVLFTANPVNPQLQQLGDQLVIESSYGLGEAVVLGKVTPDRFVLHKQTLEVIERAIAKKQHVVLAAALGDAGGEPRRAANEASLDDDQVTALARLGLQVEAHFRHPCDIEWAWAEGRFWLLQARPIRQWAVGGGQASGFRLRASGEDTSASFVLPGAWSLEPEASLSTAQVRQEEIAALRAKAEPGGTVWARYNLAEVLPAPTPMTWAIVRRFMSGRGGFGLMYRDLGFDPEPIIDEEGFIDLVCGRPYVNLSREPRLFFRDFPYGHSFAALKANPEKGMYPQPTVLPERTSGRFWLRLPVIFWKMLRAHSRMKRDSATCAEHLRKETFPRFAEEVRAEPLTDLTRLPPQELLQRLEHWTSRTLNDFARRSLKPSLFAGLALANLERGLSRVLPPDEAAQRARELLAGVRPDPEADLPAALRSLAEGQLPPEQFLKGFGHRGPREMELAEPRWAEAPETLPNAKQTDVESGWHALNEVKGVATVSTTPFEDSGRATRAAWEAIVKGARLPAKLQRSLEPEFHKARTYFGLRETAKHYLMMGYAVIRRILLELDWRFQLDGGVFDLLPEELPRLMAGEDLNATIRERRRRRMLALGLEAPAVLFSDDLEAIGRPVIVSGGLELKGTPVSAGLAEGPALVLETPVMPANTPADFVLVCPSTDPAWLPLFLRAKALVMETGGVLSHGAIVARELGLPAVAGIPDVHKRVRTGQPLVVDGNAGRVVLREGSP